MKKWIALATLICSTSLAQAAVVSKEVSYSDGTTEMKGYMAYDDSANSQRPGVIVVHEWWGHNAHARHSVDNLAKLGYNAIAVDMYGDGKTAAHPKDAMAFSGEVKQNMGVAEQRFMAAYTLLQEQGSTSKDKMAAIGYCFGGGIVLEMARRGVDLDAVVSFHGSLGTEAPAQAGHVKAQVLVMNGADDPFVKPEAIAAFKKEMKDAKVKFRFLNIPGAKHAFTNPEADENGKKFGLPLAYNAKADKQSWKEMQAFFKKVFK